MPISRRERHREIGDPGRIVEHVRSGQPIGEIEGQVEIGVREDGPGVAVGFVPAVVAREIVGDGGHAPGRVAGFAVFTRHAR